MASSATRLGRLLGHLQPRASTPSFCKAAASSCSAIGTTVVSVGVASKFEPGLLGDGSGSELEDIFAANRDWSRQLKKVNPQFFKTLSTTPQAPKFLFIGCSDSRVPADQLMGVLPGELFVHRNIANCVAHTDMNCLSVLQYAVAVLKVKHIIVCGHSGCGGVAAALGPNHLGIVDTWIRNIRETAQFHASKLAAEPDLPSKVHKLCELNVRQQVANVCRTFVVQEAWRSGSQLSVHGWIYHLRDGLLCNLFKPAISSLDQLDATFSLCPIADLSTVATPQLMDAGSPLLKK